MLFGPDGYLSSDDEGLSDDNDYYEFKRRIKSQRDNAVKQEVGDTLAEQESKRIQFVYSAITFGRYEALVSELDKGLDVDIKLEYDWTPLTLAATLANENIISELIKRGANVNQTRDSFTPLMLICNIATEDETTKSNIVECVKLLLDSGADVNAIDRKRRNCLMLAAYNGHLEVVKLLLPLIVDKEAEDNQRWTPLFWAVEGNRIEIVELLLEDDFSYDKIDIRGSTVKDIAHSNGSEDILKLLPKDTYDDEIYLYLNNNYLNFVDTFKDLKQHEKPQLFSDICKMLYGTKSESVMPLLKEKNISLLDFLSLSDSRLKDMGVVLPYQRKRIMGGLYKFHKHPFQSKSIPFVRKNELYTNIDISSTILTCVKQLIAMEASLKFIIENYEGTLNLDEKQEFYTLLSKNRGQIKRLQLVTKRFVKKTEQWDLTLKPADRITTKRWNIPWGNIWLSCSVISIAIILFKFK